MDISKEEMQIIVKDLVRKEFLKMELEPHLPKLKEKNFEVKQIELIEVIANIIDTGIRLYGAYQFGEFLGKVAYRLKNK